MKNKKKYKALCRACTILRVREKDQNWIEFYNLSLV